MKEALMMVAIYTESLLNDRSTLDGHSDSLYRVLTLMDIHGGSPIRWKHSWWSLWQPISGHHMMVRPIQRLYWNMETILTVTPTACIRSSPLRLGLHESSPERWECSSWSLQQPISGPYPDSSNLYKGSLERWKHSWRSLRQPISGPHPDG